MALFELSRDHLVRIPETRFDAGLLKSKDLQRLVRENIAVISGDLKVLAEEYGGWASGGRHADLLCIDREANLVVINIQRIAEASDIELHALRYAAMASVMTFDEAVEAAVRDRSVEGASREEIRTELLDFLDWNTSEGSEFAANVRIVLASPDFSKELTASVIWLNAHGLDIRCVRLRPHKLVDGRLLLGVEQIVPLPEAGTYEASSKKISQIAKLRISDQHQRRQRFLRALWQTGTKLTKLHENQRATMQYSSIVLHLHQGISLLYVVRQADSRVELQMDLNEWSEPVFHHLQTLQSEFEAAYGRRLQWRENGERKRLRVQETIEGGYLTAEESWPSIQEKLVDAMLHLNKTLVAFLDDANRRSLTSPASQFE